MELFSFDRKEFEGSQKVKSLDNLEIYSSESGIYYLLKPNGVSYQLDLIEASDLDAFLADVKKYNL